MKVSGCKPEPAMSRLTFCFKANAINQARRIFASPEFAFLVFLVAFFNIVSEIVCALIYVISIALKQVLSNVKISFRKHVASSENLSIKIARYGHYYFVRKEIH